MCIISFQIKEHFTLYIGEVLPWNEGVKGEFNFQIIVNFRYSKGVFTAPIIDLSNIELFVKIVNGFPSMIIFPKSYILDV